MNFFHPDNICSEIDGRWLIRPPHLPIIRGVSIDSREDQNGKAFIAIKGQTHDGHAFLADATRKGAALLIVERHPSELSSTECMALLQVSDTRRALGKLAHAYRRTLHATKVIAITGSAGKTTTKRLAEAVLSRSMRGVASSRSLNNDIGVPLTILRAKPDDQFLILEVGTNAPGEIAALGAMAQPDIAVITSIGRSHLGGLGSVEGIAAEKASLLKHLTRGGVAIVNAEAPLLRPHLHAILGGTGASIALFGPAGDADLRLTKRGQLAAGQWLEINGTSRFQLNLHGRHNAINALAAVAIGRQFGMSDAAINAGLSSVAPDAMRMVVEQIGAITVVNDAYNANPESMAAALETFAELAADAKRRVVVIGDMLELGEGGPQLHREVAARLIALNRRARVDRVVLIGDLSRAVGEQLTTERFGGQQGWFADAGREAASQIANLLRPGDAVLIKASRGMGLERLIPAIAERFASTQRSPVGSRLNAAITPRCLDSLMP